MKFAVRSLSRVHLFTTPWTAARQASPSFTISRSLLTLTAIELVMPSNCLIPCRPLSSCLQSLLAASSFPVSRLSFSNSEVTNQWYSNSGLCVCPCVYFHWRSLFLHMAWCYFLGFFFFFRLKDFLWFYLCDRSGSNELCQFLFIWECLCESGSVSPSDMSSCSWPHGL